MEVGHRREQVGAAARRISGYACNKVKKKRKRERENTLFVDRPLRNFSTVSIRYISKNETCSQGVKMTTSTDKKTKVVTKDKQVNKDKQVKREPVVPSSNKLVSARWEDKCREIHLQKLKNMKPAIDNVPPKEYPHLTNNKKRLQLQEGVTTNMIE